MTTNTGAGYSTSSGGLTTNWNLGDPGWHNWGKDYAITENVTKVLGPHTLKFGAYINWDKKAQTATWPQNASIDFSSNAIDAAGYREWFGKPDAGQFQQLLEANAAIYPYFGFQEQDFYVRTVGRSIAG